MYVHGIIIWYTSLKSPGFYFDFTTILYLHYSSDNFPLNFVNDVMITFDVQVVGNTK